MNFLAEIQEVLAIDVRIEQNKFYVQLEDGREIGVPYNWFWLLNQATDAERKDWRFISDRYGIHWEVIDEDISIAGIIKGHKNQEPPRP
ncbi:MAG: DUF2442 domain-containing protein [Saprospiraceae bacterium]|nr:DUF2442 domain-containing protein [Saprospiraceae bacterium]MCB9325255.1 DUF2442 domain-containing protein [Lewinellaceae bacterium]